MYQRVRNLMLPRYCRNGFLPPHRLHYDLVSLLLCPSTRFGHLSSLSTSLLGTPGLWKLPRCGTGGKINQRKQSFFLSFFHSFPHRLENSAQWTNPQPGRPRRVFHSSHSPYYCYHIQPRPCSFCPDYLLLIPCSESGGTRQDLSTRPLPALPTPDSHSALPTPHSPLCTPTPHSALPTPHSLDSSDSFTLLLSVQAGSPLHTLYQQLGLSEFLYG